MDAAMTGVFFWSVAVIAAVFVGMGKGGLPVIGMLSVPILALAVSPVTAAGLLLPVYVLSDMFAIYNYRSSFDARVIWIIGAGATAGVGLGWATAHITPEWLVTIVMGLIGTVFALNLLFRNNSTAQRKARVPEGLFWGMVTGFTSFVSHSGGPPYQVYVLPLNQSKLVFAGTGTLVFAYINAIKLVPYYFLGQFSLQNLEVAAMLMPVAAASVFGGVRLIKLLPEKLFFQAVTWALLLVSIKLIWDGVRGM
jgi:uncharacterized membrane protein YfcA